MDLVRLTISGTYGPRDLPVYTGQRYHHRFDRMTRTKVVTNDHQRRTSGDDQNSDELTD